MGNWCTLMLSTSSPVCKSRLHLTVLFKLQGDLWQWFLEPSLYGTDVLTLGGSRGPSVSYYVPYLSAMQLLLPVPSPPQEQSAASTPVSDAPAALLAAQQSQQSAEDGVQRVSAEQAQMGAGGPSQPAAEAVLPRAGKLYHIEDDWQHWSRQVIPLTNGCRTFVPWLSAWCLSGFTFAADVLPLLHL